MTLRQNSGKENPEDGIPDTEQRVDAGSGLSMQPLSVF